MLQVTPQMRVLVAVEPIDGRKGIDSLAALCRQKLGADPFSGSVFIFRTRGRTAINVLVYDGQGFWLAQKRLSQGRFHSWPSGDWPAQTLEDGPGLLTRGQESSSPRGLGRHGFSWRPRSSRP